MLRILALTMAGGLALGLALPALAQQAVSPCTKNTANTHCWPVTPSEPLPVTGSPSGTSTQTTTTAEVVIATGGTFQVGLAASSTRAGCTLQFLQGTAADVGYVYFGAALNATEALSFELTNGQTVNCQTPSGVATDAIQVTGTSTGDIFIVTNQ